MSLGSSVHAFGLGLWRPLRRGLFCLRIWLILWWSRKVLEGGGGGVPEPGIPETAIIRRFDGGMVWNFSVGLG